ncbi:MAG: hypothetical protein RJQ14_06805 [Marinoscillum sp.]
MTFPKKGLSALFIIFMTLSAFSMGSRGSFTTLNILLDFQELPFLAFNFLKSTVSNTEGMIIWFLTLMATLGFFSQRFLFNLESK